MNTATTTVEIECRIVMKTEKAMLIDNGTTKAWIPLSQIIDQTIENGSLTSITISEWLATEKGLV